MIAEIVLFVFVALLVVAVLGLFVVMTTTYIDNERLLDEREKMIKKRKAEFEEGAK